VRVRVIAATVCLALFVPAAAFANGDPASDVLLQAKEYFPTQRVSVAAASSLKQTVNEANAKGYRIRVALIHDESDLGTVPTLLNQPQKYAQFLGPEIGFVYKGDVLVVMPGGLGVTSTDPSPAPAKAIAGMKVEAGGLPDGLAQTAQEAVTRLAAAAGHPLAAVKKSSGGGGSAAGIIVAAVLLALGLGGAFLVRRREAAAAGADESAPAP
jgi:MYXO-CTERM domain-containing protein